MLNEGRTVYKWLGVVGNSDKGPLTLPTPFFSEGMSTVPDPSDGLSQAGTADLMKMVAVT